MPSQVEKFQLTQQFMPKVNLLSDLKDQAALKERDIKSCMSAINHILEDAAARVDTTRASNMVKRKDIQTCMHTDHDIIAEVLGHRPADMAGLLRASAQKAIDAMHQRVCLSRRRYDEIAHTCKSHIDTLKDIDFECMKVVNWADKFQNDDQAENHRRLLNDIDKTKARLESALLIADKYEAVKDILRKELNMYPARLAELRDLEKAAKQELQETGIMREVAEKLSTEAAKELVAHETVTFEGKKERDEVRKATKDKAFAIFAPSEDRAERKGKTQWNIDQEEIRKARQAFKNKVQQQEQRQEKILELQSIVLRLKNALKASEVDEMLFRAANLDQVGTKLNDRRRSKAHRRDILKEEMAKLDSNFEFYQHGSQPTSELLNHQLEETEQRWEETKNIFKKVAVTRNRSEILYANIVTGIHVLFDKLKNTQITGGMESRPVGDPLEDFGTVEYKLLVLNETVRPDFGVLRSRFMQDSKFFSMTLQNIAPDSLRVNVDRDPSTDDFHLRTEPNNDGFLSRLDIKRMSEELIAKKERKLKAQQHKGAARR